MKRKQLENDLKSLGWWFLRHGGSHDIWTDGERTEPIPRHTEINELLARSIIRKAQKDRTMRFEGKLHTDGPYWLVEIPILDLMTQGRTRAEAYDMAADLIESMVNKDGFKANVYKGEDDTFEVGSADAKAMISLLLQRKREASGLSLAQVAKRLGAKSRNAYARYEKGESAPTVEKLVELLNAVSQTEIVIHDSELR